MQFCILRDRYVNMFLIHVQAFKASGIGPSALSSRFVCLLWSTGICWIFRKQLNESIFIILAVGFLRPQGLFHKLIRW